MAFRRKEYSMTVCYQPEIRIQECTRTEDKDLQYCMKVCFQPELTVQECTPTEREGITATKDKPICTLMKEWAQTGMQPKQILDIIDHSSQYHAMYPCYLVQFGEVNFLKQDLTKHAYSDYKPLITAVYNKNHEAVKRLMQNDMTAVFPDARGYGIFHGDNIVTDYMTSAVDIAMERDDVDTLQVMTDKYAAIWDSLLLLSMQYNAQKCKEFINSSRTPGHLHDFLMELPLIHLAINVIPPFDNLRCHARTFSSPFATKTQCENTVEMFAKALCSEDKSRAVMELAEQDTDEQKAVLLHYYVTLHTFRILVIYHKLSEKWLSWDPLVSDAVSESTHTVPLYQEMIKIFASSASLRCPVYNLITWLSQVFEAHNQNNELLVIQWTSFIKICLMHGVIPLHSTEIQILSSSHLYALAKIEYLPLLPVSEAFISMMPHHTFEAYRLEHEKTYGTRVLMPSPRSLVDLCRLWIYEHVPEGKMPSIATQLGLPSGCMNLLTADTTPVLVKYTFHTSTAKKIIMQHQNRIAQTQ